MRIKQTFSHFLALFFRILFVLYSSILRQALRVLPTRVLVLLRKQPISSLRAFFHCLFRRRPFSFSLAATKHSSPPHINNNNDNNINSNSVSILMSAPNHNQYSEESYPPAHWSSSNAGGGAASSSFDSGSSYPTIRSIGRPHLPLPSSVYGASSSSSSTLPPFASHHHNPLTDFESDDLYSDYPVAGPPPLPSSLRPFGARGGFGSFGGVAPPPLPLSKFPSTASTLDGPSTASSNHPPLTLEERLASLNRAAAQTFEIKDPDPDDQRYFDTLPSSSDWRSALLPPPPPPPPPQDVFDGWIKNFAEEFVANFRKSFNDGFPTYSAHKDAVKELNNAAAAKAKQRKEEASSVAAASGNEEGAPAAAPPVVASVSLRNVQSFTWLRFAKVLVKEALDTPRIQDALLTKLGLWGPSSSVSDTALPATQDRASHNNKAQVRADALTKLFTTALRTFTQSLESSSDNVVFDVAWSIQKRGLSNETASVIRKTMIRSAMREVRRSVIPNMATKFHEVLLGAFAAASSAASPPNTNAAGGESSAAVEGPDSTTTTTGTTVANETATDVALFPSSSAPPSFEGIVAAELHRVILDLTLRWVLSFFPYLQWTMRRDCCSNLQYQMRCVEQRNMWNEIVKVPTGEVDTVGGPNTSRLLRRAALKRDLVAEHREGHRSNAAVPVPRRWFSALLRRLHHPSPTTMTSSECISTAPPAAATAPTTSKRADGNVNSNNSNPDDDNEWAFHESLPTVAVVSIDLEVADFWFEEPQTTATHQHENSSSSPCLTRQQGDNDHDGDNEIVFLSEGVFLCLWEHYGGGPKLTADGCCDETNSRIRTQIEEPIVDISVALPNFSELLVVHASPAECIADVLIECAAQVESNIRTTWDEGLTKQAHWLAKMLRYGLLSLDREDEFANDANSASSTTSSSSRFVSNSSSSFAKKVNLRALPLSSSSVQTWLEASGGVCRVVSFLFPTEADMIAARNTSASDSVGSASSSSSHSFRSPFPRFPSSNAALIPGVCGLNNLGNTCFMNSALQILSNATLFRDALFQFPASRTLDVSTSLVCAFREVLLKLWSGSSASYEPKHWKTLLGKSHSRFAGYEQQDAIEFIDIALDRMHEEINIIGKKQYRERNDAIDAQLSVARLSEVYWLDYRENNQSLIADWFAGQTKTRYQCTLCPRKSLVFESFNTLPIAILSDDSITIELSLTRCFEGTPAQPKPPLGYPEVVRLRLKIAKESTLGGLLAELRAQLLASTVDTSGSPLTFSEQEDVRNVMLFQSPAAQYFQVTETSLKSPVNVNTQYTAFIVPSRAKVVAPDDEVNPKPADSPSGWGDSLDVRRLSPSAASATPPAFQLVLWYLEPNTQQGAIVALGRPTAVRWVSSQTTQNELWAMAQEVVDGYLEETHPHSTTGAAAPAAAAAATAPPPTTATGSDEVDFHFGSASSADGESPQPIPDICVTAAASDNEDGGVPTAAASAAAPSSSSRPYQLLQKSVYHHLPMKLVLHDDEVPVWSTPVSFGTKIVIAYDPARLKRKPELEVHHPSVLRIPTNTERLQKQHSFLTLESCIQRMRETNTLKGDDKWYCPDCKTHVEAQTDCELYRPPKVLVCYFKRFKPASHGYTMVKNDTTVQVPLELNVEDLIAGGAQADEKGAAAAAAASPSSRDAVDSTSSAEDKSVLAAETASDDIIRSTITTAPANRTEGTYVLRGVVHHSGSLSGGHYTAVAFSEGVQRWVQYNDSSAYVVDEPPSSEGVYVMLYELLAKGTVMPDAFYGSTRKTIHNSAAAAPPSVFSSGYDKLD